MSWKMCFQGLSQMRSAEKTAAAHFEKDARGLLSLSMPMNAANCLQRDQKYCTIVERRLVQDMKDMKLEKVQKD